MLDEGTLDVSGSKGVESRKSVQFYFNRLKVNLIGAWFRFKTNRITKDVSSVEEQTCLVFLFSLFLIIFRAVKLCLCVCFFVLGFVFFNL